MVANMQKVLGDIATRTKGDIYIGVVGPVRVGKSTFITRFMQQAVVPKLDDVNERQRLVDELPLSGDGSTIMTTQPRFVPAKAAQIRVGSSQMRIRMVDCVGYLVEGASGHIVDGKPRMVKTPWQEREMTFEKAAEFGTRKVIKDHSTLAIVMTTDGTITDIPRANYVTAEERTIAQLKKLGKPFVIVINTRDTATARTLASELTIKHGVHTLAVNADNLTNDNVTSIFNALLAEFPINGFRVTMPKWLRVLDVKSDIIAEAIETIRRHANSVRKIAEAEAPSLFEKSVNFASLSITNIDVVTGVVTYNLVPREDLYNRVLTTQAGVDLSDQAHLVAFLRHSGGLLNSTKQIRDAMLLADETGYGIISPQFADFVLDRPTLNKAGKNFGLKLRATAPSFHLVKVDVATQVTPTIGSRAQSEEMLKLMQAEFDKDPNALWVVPVFGRSLGSIVEEGIQSRVHKMNDVTRIKLKRTITKIVNSNRTFFIAI